jgi:hypothetical protein
VPDTLAADAREETASTWFEWQEHIKHRTVVAFVH